MKSVIIILLVFCSSLCAVYSAPVNTQKYTKVQDVFNLLNQVAKQQSSSRSSAAALTQAMKLAAAQVVSPCLSSQSLCSFEGFEGLGYPGGVVFQ